MEPGIQSIVKGEAGVKEKAGVKERAGVKKAERSPRPLARKGLVLGGKHGPPHTESNRASSHRSWRQHGTDGAAASRMAKRMPWLDRHWADQLGRSS